MIEKIQKPVNQITVRDTLFGDLPLDYWAGIDCDDMPWSLFKDAKKSVDNDNKEDAIKTLKKVLNVPALESRQYLQASYFLNELGSKPENEIEILGVVLEVAMVEGLDLLAIYADHTARYHNYSGSAIIWDSRDSEIDSKIDEILRQSTDIVARVGPWKDDRLPAPVGGFARINFLTTHGLYFGEARQQVLFSDPLAGKTMYALLDMMETLMAKTNNQ